MYFAAKIAAKSLTKQIHTAAQKSKLEPRTCLEETFLFIFFLKKHCIDIFLIHGRTLVGRNIEEERIDII